MSVSRTRAADEARDRLFETAHGQRVTFERSDGGDEVVQRVRVVEAGPDDAEDVEAGSGVARDSGPDVGAEQAQHLLTAARVGHRGYLQEAVDQLEETVALARLSRRGGSAKRRCVARPAGLPCQAVQELEGEGGGVASGYWLPFEVARSVLAGQQVRDAPHDDGGHLLIGPGAAQEPEAFHLDRQRVAAVPVEQPGGSRAVVRHELRASRDRLDEGSRRPGRRWRLDAGLPVVLGGDGHGPLDEPERWDCSLDARVQLPLGLLGGLIVIDGAGRHHVRAGLVDGAPLLQFLDWAHQVLADGLILDGNGGQNHHHAALTPTIRRATGAVRSHVGWRKEPIHLRGPAGYRPAGAGSSPNRWRTASGWTTWRTAGLGSGTWGCRTGSSTRSSAPVARPRHPRPPRGSSADGRKGRARTTRRPPWRGLRRGCGPALGSWRGSHRRTPVHRDPRSTGSRPRSRGRGPRT